MIMFGDFIYCGFEVFMHYLLRYLDLVLSIHYDKHRNENMQTFSKISEPNHLNYPFAFDTKLHVSFWVFYSITNLSLMFSAPGKRFFYLSFLSFLDI